MSVGGRVTVVAGVGGGAGASTLASGLALAGGGGTWLIDLDHDRGDLAPSWDLVGDRTTEDLLPVAGELSVVHLRHAGRAHRSGTTLLAAPARPGAGARWGPRAIAALVAAAREAAGPPGVVVDAGAGVPPDGSGGDALLLVCPPTLCAARRGVAALAALRARHDDRVCGLVVCGRPGRGELGARALGRLVGAPIAGALPWSPREAGALGGGRWPAGRRARLARAVREVAEWTP